MTEPSADAQQEKLRQEAKFLPRTPSEEIGPMYPVQPLEDRGDDLAVSKSSGKSVEGQIL